MVILVQLFSVSQRSHKCTQSLRVVKPGKISQILWLNVQTATKYYRLQEKSKSSVEASKQLRTVMRGLDQKARPDSPPLYSNPPASEAIAPNTSRTSWDEDMADAIKTLFKDEIKDEAITLQTVKTRISDHPLLKEEDHKRVLDKVRAFWHFSKSPSPEPLCLPTEVETLHQCTGRRKIYGRTHVRIMRQWKSTFKHSL